MTLDCRTSLWGPSIASCTVASSDVPCDLTKPLPKPLGRDLKHLFQHRKPSASLFLVFVFNVIERSITVKLPLAEHQS